MRAWVCFLFSFILISSASAQCPYAPVYSDQFRASFLDVAVDGNDLWAATAYGLALYDRGVDPPAFVSAIALNGTTRIVRIANGLAYAGSGTSIAVVRKNGRALQVVRAVDTGATINDIIATPLDLYVASAAGLTQYDLLDPTTPAKTSASLHTSGTNVFALTLIGSSLYAADGDTSVEVFSLSVPSLPQNIGTLTSSIVRPTSVRTANGKLFVSDGHQSEFWIGSGAQLTLAGSYSFGATSIAQISGDAVFLGANDRNVRAVDFSVASSPVAIFATTIPTTSGTINRVSGLALAGNRLYVAAGDSGLLTYDTTSFAPPFPLRDFPSGASTSIVSLGAKVYTTKSAGGITEFAQSNNGTLTQQRTWDGSNVDTVFDGGNGFLISAKGATMTLWTLTSTIPTSISTAQFRAGITSAALVGLTAYAVLSDRTVWSADLSAATATPVQVQVPANPTSVARSGNALAYADPRSDGTTTIVYYADPSRQPSSANVPGFTTTPVAVSGATAAVFTFRGANLVDFPSGTSTVLPQSGGSIARSVAITPSSVLVLNDTTMTVWDRASQRATAQYVIPSTPSMMSVSGDAPTIADISTTSGIATIAFAGSTKLPASIATPNANAFYKKVVATPDRVVLSDQIAFADIYTTALHHVGTIHAAGLLDVAANATGTYVLFANRTIASYSIDGIPRSQTTINDTSDTQPLSINGAGNAIWVSYSRGCLTATCEKRTNVYDAALNQTATFAGGVIDVAVSGNRAYALVDLPGEVRAYDVTDPLHPAQLASHATEGGVPNNSIAVSGNTVYVLGEKLYAYDAASMTKTGEQFSSFTADPTTGLSAIDQHIRADGTCAMMTGRSFAATLLSLSSAIVPAPIGDPSTARFLAVQPGVFYVLTDHSLEIVSTKPMPSLPRHHAAK